MWTLVLSKIMLNPKEDNIVNKFLKSEYPFKEEDAIAAPALHSDTGMLEHTCGTEAQYTAAEFNPRTLRATMPQAVVVANWATSYS